MNPGFGPRKGRFIAGHSLPSFFATSLDLKPIYVDFLTMAYDCTNVPLRATCRSSHLFRCWPKTHSLQRVPFGRFLARTVGVLNFIKLLTCSRMFDV